MQLPDFRNEPLSDFKGNPEHFRRMKEAVQEVGKELGREYPLVLGGERIKTEEKLTSVNPAQKDQVVGVFSEEPSKPRKFQRGGAYHQWVVQPYRH